MESNLDGIKKNFWLFSGIGLFLILIFFACGFYFNIWGKKFEDLPSWLEISSYLYIIVFFVYLLLYTKFVLRHQETLQKYWKKKK